MEAGSLFGPSDGWRGEQSRVLRMRQPGGRLQGQMEAEAVPLEVGAGGPWG